MLQDWPTETWGCEQERKRGPHTSFYALQVEVQKRSNELKAAGGTALLDEEV